MSTTSKSDLYRKLPSVDELLHAPEIADSVEREGRTSVAEAARVVLARLRAEISAGRLDAPSTDLALAGLVPAVEPGIGDASTSLEVPATTSTAAAPG